MIFCLYLLLDTQLIKPFIIDSSVLLNTKYKKYLLSYNNADLINLYNIIKTQYDNFVRDTKIMFIGKFYKYNFLCVTR